MKNFKKGLLFLGLVMSLSSSLVLAATYDAEYGNVVGSSSTTYTAGAEVTASGVTYIEYSTSFSGTPDSDELLAGADLSSSGEATELAFLSAVTGESFTKDQYTKVEDSSGFTVTNDEGTGLSTLNLASDFDDGYFLLKFGDGKTNDSHWIFENNAPLSSLVWLTELSFKASQGGFSILDLSHYASAPCVGNDCGFTPGDGSEVPIPAAIWLFGSALFGLMGVSRKQKAMTA